MSDFEEAFNVIKKEFQKDSEAGSAAHVLQCSIAMMCYDAICDAELEVNKETETIDAFKTGNDAASRFMKIYFDVETK